MRDVETLFEDLDAMEAQCAPDATTKLGELHTQWIAARDELRGVTSSDASEALQSVLKERLAEVGIEVLGRMYREKDSALSLMFPVDLLDLAQSDATKAEQPNWLGVGE